MSYLREMEKPSPGSCAVPPAHRLPLDQETWALLARGSAFRGPREGSGRGSPASTLLGPYEAQKSSRSWGAARCCPTAIVPGCRGTCKAQLAAEEMKTTSFRRSAPDIPPGGDSVTGRSLLPSPAPQGLPSPTLLLPPPCPHFIPAPQQSEAPSSRQPSCHVPALTCVPEGHFPGVFPSGKESQLPESSQSRAGQLLHAQLGSALPVQGPPRPPRSYHFPKEPAPAIFYFPLPDSGQISPFLFPVTSYLLSHRVLCPLDFLQTLCPGAVLQPRVTSGLTLGGIDLFLWRGHPACRPPAKCCWQQAAASLLSPS